MIILFLSGLIIIFYYNEDNKKVKQMKLNHSKFEYIFQNSLITKWIHPSFYFLFLKLTIILTFLMIYITLEIILMYYCRSLSLTVNNAIIRI